jgi:hypothetical protein
MYTAPHFADGKENGRLIYMYYFIVLLERAVSQSLKTADIRSSNSPQIHES